MKYIDRLLSLEKQIGNTKVIKFTFEYNNQIKKVYAKEEYLNPSSSIKIRPAYQIIYDAICEGKLKENQRVVEVSSGNMGIALAYICKEIGNPLTILMPKSMSKERINMLNNLGAEVVLTEDFLDAFNQIKEYIAKGSYCPSQFDNVSNIKGYTKAANEILGQIGYFDGFVSGVGTGGTLMGIGGILKQERNAKVILIDPKESGLMKYGASKGHHKIQGLSDQIIPSLYNKDIVDELIEISSDDAICMARKIKETFNIGIGISSGANLLGALLSNENKLVTVLPDDDQKYLSTDLFNPNIKSKLVDSIKFISKEEL